MAARGLGAAAVVALAVATAAATGSDSQAQSPSLRTPPVSVQVGDTRVGVPPVSVTVPTTPVSPPKVTLPPTPVEPPPVEPPSLPVKPPSQPAEPPSPPVRVPALPDIGAGGVTKDRGETSDGTADRLPRSLGLGSDASGAVPGSGAEAPPAGAGGSAASLSAHAETAAGTAQLLNRSTWAKLTPVQQRTLRRLAFDTPPRKQRLRELRTTLREYRDCLGVLPDRGRRALELRAGLFGREPATRRVIAHRIGTSPIGVVRLERESLRRLVRAGESGACGGGAATATGGPGGATATDGGPVAGSDGPAGRASGGGGGPQPAGEVLADVREGGPGVDLGDGEEGALETLLLFLLAALVVLGPLAVVASRRYLNGAAAAAGDGERPLLFLDVDGVIALSPFWSGLPPGRLRELSLGVTYVPDRVGGLVRELATRFDIVWATGWEHYANASLLEPLGLAEELPVLTFGKKSFGSSDWKIKRIDRYARHRPAAWLDDTFAARHERWAAHRSEPTLLVGVDPRSGLAPQHVERLLRWADRVAPQQAASPGGERRLRAG